MYNQYYYPYCNEPYYQPYYPENIKSETLNKVDPIVRYGLREARWTSVPHAMREVAAQSYLVGKGYDQQTAYRMVESWEVNERFR